MTTSGTEKSAADGAGRGGRAGSRTGRRKARAIPGVTVSLRFGMRKTPAVVKARQAYVRPLFDYLSDHSLIGIRVAQRAADAVGAGHISRNRLMRFKNGENMLPPWFIAAVCREIGQPIEVVMGAEWAQRHLPLPAPDLPVDLPNLPVERPDARRAS